MEGLISVEPGHSDSTSLLSEPPDITNWFSNYVYESFPLCSLLKESESELKCGFSVGEVNKNLGVAVAESKSPEKFVSNKDHKPMSMKQISDRNLYESLPSEPPDIGNWFSSYNFESPMLDTSDGLEFSVPGESECVKETQLEEEITNNDRNGVCPRLFEQELVSSAKVTGFSQSQSVLSEPPDVRNWFSSYEYQSPKLDTHELEFYSSEKDQLIIDESDTEEENSSGIFRKTRSKQETTSPGKLKSNDCKEKIAADTTNEVSSDNAYLDQELEMKSSVGLFSDSKKEVKQESSFEQEPIIFEPRCSPGVSRYNSKPQFPSKKNEASLHDPRPQHTQETISMSSSRRKSPTKAAQKACLEENLESVDQESDDKENADGKSIEAGFVTMKKVRFREARDRRSMTKPHRGVLVECSRGKELKNIAGEEDKEERKKKRRVLGEMSNHQFSGAEEIAGKWHCPHKNKGKSGPPLKQLRLDSWIHKV